jgi:ABC-2 type transport system permease protein
MWRRVSGLLLRYLYLYRRSLPRVMGIVFWPVMDLLVWGFITRWIQQESLSAAATFLLGSAILWDVFYSSQQAITLSVTEDIWGRNILNVFLSPIRVSELILATCLLGAIRSLTSAGILAVLALLFYDFSVFASGLALAPFVFALLLFGWTVGMMTMALILRYGQAAEALIWGIPFLIQPVSAVFYPIGVLPAWLQPISKAFPSTHVFEGMRTALTTGALDGMALAWAIGLDLVYLAAAGVFFGWMLGRVREKGYLSRLGME